MIKFANKEDIEGIVSLRLKYFKEIYDVDEEIFEKLKFENIEYIDKHLNHDLFISLVKEGDFIVSTSFLNIYSRAANMDFPNSYFGEIYGVYTDKDYRGRGYASDNMKLLIDKAKNLELSCLRLDATSLEGYRIYKELGFKKLSTSDIAMEYKLL